MKSHQKYKFSSRHHHQNKTRREVSFDKHTPPRRSGRRSKPVDRYEPEASSHSHSGYVPVDTRYGLSGNSHPSKTTKTLNSVNATLLAIPKHYAYVFGLPYVREGSLNSPNVYHAMVASKNLSASLFGIKLW